MSADGEDIVALPRGSAVIAHSAQSDVGRVRSVNEDSFLAEAPVYLVAIGFFLALARAIKRQEASA